MRQWVIRADNIVDGTSTMLFGEIYTDFSIAESKVFDLNKNMKDTGYHYVLIEMVEVHEKVKAVVDMTDEEHKEYIEEIQKINNDLSEIIQYDEWAGREYGEDKVDYYWTAISMYNAGYRKVKKIS